MGGIASLACLFEEINIGVDVRSLRLTTELHRSLADDDWTDSRWRRTRNNEGGEAFSPSNQLRSNAPNSPLQVPLPFQLPAAPIPIPISPFPFIPNHFSQAVRRPALS